MDALIRLASRPRMLGSLPSSSLQSEINRCNGSLQKICSNWAIFDDIGFAPNVYCFLLNDIEQGLCHGKAYVVLFNVDTTTPKVFSKGLQFSTAILTEGRTTEVLEVILEQILQVLIRSSMQGILIQLGIQIFPKICLCGIVSINPILPFLN